MPRYSLPSILGGNKNSQKTVLVSAARTASVVSGDIKNPGARGAHFIIDVSSITDTPQILVTLQGKDPVSGNYYTLLTGPLYTTVNTNVLKIYPGITESTNLAVSDILPSTYRVVVTHVDTDSITYSVAVLPVI